MSRSYTAAALHGEGRQICDLAEKVAREELRPRAAERETEDFDRAIVDQLGELGFLGMLVPAEYDGLGTDMLTYLCALEELAWGDPAVALSVSVHNSLPTRILLRHGTEEQKERWLRPMARGEVLGAFSLSEANAGSDAASLTTQATRTDDGGWVLNGEKMWVTNGETADLITLFARTDEPGDRRGKDGIGAFVVPTDRPGYVPGKEEQKMGLRASETVSVQLDGLELGPEHLIGEPSMGFKYALQGLTGGRLGIASQALGIAQAALDHAVEYAAEREQFGTPVGQFQGMRFKLADMSTRVDAARSLTHRAARLVEDGEPEARRFSSMAKLEASEAAMQVTREAVQVFGGYGYVREYPVERLFRDAKVTEIYEGTSEIHRSIIGKQLFRERGLET